MYKLIIGNVRITVSDDSISQGQAAAIARQAINEATQQGKLLSHIEITNGDSGPQAVPTEKAGCRSSRKTLKQSMLDGMLTAVKEKLHPTNSFTNKDSWFDGDTSQEWRGSEVDTTRDDLIAKFEEWMKTV